MSLVTNQPLEIDKKEPFKSDLLGRRENITILSKFIQSYHQSMLICIDGAFGQGKTTFLKMWQQSLLNQKVPTLYFNAWQNHFADDVLVCILGEIELVLESLGVPDLAKSKALLAGVIEKAIPLVKTSKHTTIQIGQLSEQESKSISTSITALNEQQVREQIIGYGKSKQSLAEFKLALHDFVASLSDNRDPKPLVFMLDEVDRCKPQRAIDVLETIEHLFNDDNIRFVLASDKIQLGHLIRSAYGQDFDVIGYLRRFVDFDYMLPPPPKERSYIGQLLKHHDLMSHVTKNFRYQDIEPPLKELVQAYHLSLREQEIYVYMLNFVLRTRYVKEQTEYLTICFLIALKIKKPDLYMELTREQVTNVDAIFSHINQTFNQSKQYKEFGSGMLEAAIFGYTRSKYRKDEDIMAQLEEYFEQYNTPEQKRKDMHQFFLQVRIPLDNPPLQDFKNAIELSSKFELTP